VWKESGEETESPKTLTFWVEEWVRAYVSRHFRTRF